MALLTATGWWTVALRGVAAILFGLVTLVSPVSSLFALVLIFGLYALVDGSFNLSTALRAGPLEGPRWALIVEGVASLVAGLAAFVWPGITAIALLYVIAAWAVSTGAAEILAAVRLRKQLRGEWLLVVAGMLSIAFGVVLFARPGLGALAVVLWIGAYALVFGVLLLALALRLRAWTEGSRRPIPPDGVPTAA
jgi:uncharacterized membrane protein HdeD (DUF308 family)